MPAVAQTAPDPVSAYVRARAADAAGDSSAALAGYAAALTRDPNDAVVAFRAYRLALMTGDFALAGRAEAILAKTEDAPLDTPILRFALALQAKDRAGARAAMTRMGGGPLAFMVQTLSAWLAVEAGEDPFPILDQRSVNPLARRYALENRALILIALKRADEGLPLLNEILGASENDTLRVDGAMLLAQTGRRDDAMALLQGTKPEMVALRTRLARGIKPGAAFGASRMFLSLAADLATEESAPEITVVLTRSALLLDPSDDRARLYLADALSKSGFDRLAISVLDQIRPASPFIVSADATRVTVLRRAGRGADALALAKAKANARGAGAADARAYGDLLAGEDQFDAAAAAYAMAMQRPGGDADWSLHSARGVALDRAGHWDQAEPELRRAAELAPREPQALATLGTALIERGEDLDEAQSILERANRLKPDDAAIIDALAWAYYRRGDAARALPLLERAAQGDAGSVQINEHLGDAYWKLGRKYEARYAWRAAAIYADAPATARLEGKIARGL